MATQQEAQHNQAPAQSAGSGAKNDQGLERARSYGRFYRSVPLPEGAKPESASATFENGVLRVELQAPGGGQQPQRIEVREGSPH